MEMKYLCTYENLGHYLEHMNEEDAWEQIMIAPYWEQITQWAPFPLDYMKPKAITGRQVLLQQIEQFKSLDLHSLAPEFERITAKLPKADDDPVTIAFYPSDNVMEEGVYGTGAWGNIIININPLNSNSLKWTPFVFAHEYHHTVLGDYWYCIKGGRETKGNFLEAIINEGQADLFAQSTTPSLSPSWHKGVPAEGRADVWEKLKKVLYNTGPAQDFAPYMFGDEKLEIPPYAGYYFGCAIVEDYIHKYPDTDFPKLLKTPHQEIFNESSFS